MRKASVIFNTAAGVLIAIPIVIAKWNTLNQPDPSVRPVTEYEIESMIAHNAEPELGTETEIVTEVIELLEAETPEEIFKGYDFIPFSKEFQEEIISLCEMHGIAYELILAIIKTETEFKWCTGDGGQAIGYMQIWPKYWQKLADEYGLDLYEPIDNVHMGIIIISTLLESNSGSLDKTLKEYNSGNPDYESNEYLNKVYENYEWIMGEIDGRT